MIRGLKISILLFLTLLGCSNNSRQSETNKILSTIVKHSRDSTAVYFQKVDSLGEEKIETVTYPKDPDSVAVYYESVDSLRFNIPITKKELHRYQLVKHPIIDSLITDSIIAQWNEELRRYIPQKWTRKEIDNLPVIYKRPEYLDGFYKNQGELQKIFYFSKPFFNKKKTKALIYRYKLSSAGKNGQLYILTKDGEDWDIVYKGVTFVSSF